MSLKKLKKLRLFERILSALNTLQLVLGDPNYTHIHCICKKREIVVFVAILVH